MLKPGICPGFRSLPGLGPEQVSGRRIVRTTGGPVLGCGHRHWPGPDQHQSAIELQPRVAYGCVTATAAED